MLKLAGTMLILINTGPSNVKYWNRPKVIPEAILVLANLGRISAINQQLQPDEITVTIMGPFCMLVVKNVQNVPLCIPPFLRGHGHSCFDFCFLTCPPSSFFNTMTLDAMVAWGYP